MSRTSAAVSRRTKIPRWGSCTTSRSATRIWKASRTVCRETPNAAVKCCSRNDVPDGSSPSRMRSRRISATRCAVVGRRRSAPTPVSAATPFADVGGMRLLLRRENLAGREQRSQGRCGATPLLCSCWTNPYFTARTRTAGSARGVTMLVLLGVLLVVVGFALRLNPMLVVTVAGLVTGALGGMSPREILDAFGTGFAGSRSIVIFLLVLPVIGLVERNGLQEQSRRLIARMARLTTGRVMALYLLVRQATCAIGLLSIGGHAQSVRPIVAPMAEAAAVKRHGPLSRRLSERIRAFAAGTDNVGAFFGEDIFVAVGAVLLITSFVDTTYHLTLRPLDVALWAIPTAVCALLIHGFRSLRLDRDIARQVEAEAARGERVEEDEEYETEEEVRP